MSVPVNFSMGLDGNTPTPQGVGKGAGAWSIGADFDIYAKYKVTLAYNDYFGPLPKDPATGLWTGAANGAGVYRDRGWVSLTFKTTF
jgi:hypothetical protein